MSVYFLSVIKMCHPGMALNGPEKRHGEKKRKLTMGEEVKVVFLSLALALE